MSLEGRHTPQASEGDVNLSPQRRAWQTAHIGPRAQALLQRDEAAFLRQSLSTPCLNAVGRAAGALLHDADGREILDFHGNSVHQVGYGHPRVVEAIKATLDQLPFCPRRYTNEPAVQLAERLAALAFEEPAKVLFAPSGSAAVGMALKLARYATGRHKTLSMWDSFHGANLDAISVGGEALFRRGAGPLLPGAEHVPPLDQAERLFGAGEEGFRRLAEMIDYVLSLEGDIGAFIAEPVRWTTVTPPPADFWPSVAASCRRNGTLLIFDEIPSCLGRTGAMFAFEHFGCRPDMVVLGKGLGGGVMPLAALVARADLDVAPEAAIGHYTHEKNPVAAAAALATLDVIADEGLVQRAATLGATILERLRRLARGSPLLKEARGLGLFFGLELAGAPETAAQSAERVLYACLSRGLSFKLGGGNVITLCPALNIPDEQLDRALAILEDALAEQPET